MFFNCDIQYICYPSNKSANQEINKSTDQQIGSRRITKKTSVVNRQTDREPNAWRRMMRLNGRGLADQVRVTWPYNDDMQKSTKQNEDQYAGM